MGVPRYCPPSRLQHGPHRPSKMKKPEDREKRGVGRQRPVLNSVYSSLNKFRFYILFFHLITDK